MSSKIGSLPIFSSKARLWSVSTPEKLCAAFLCNVINDQSHAVAFDCTHSWECALEPNRCLDFKFARQVSQPQFVARWRLGPHSKVPFKNYCKSIGSRHWARDEINGQSLGGQAWSIHHCHWRRFLVAQWHDSNLRRCHYGSGIARPRLGQGACHFLPWPESTFWHLHSRGHLQLLCLAQEHSRFICRFSVDLEKDLRCVQFSWRLHHGRGLSRFALWSVASAHDQGPKLGAFLFGRRFARRIRRASETVDL